MLQFRDSRDGSIELTGAHPSGLAQLLAGRPTRLSSLIRDQELLSDARRRARSIRQKAEQLANERAINTAHLAIGFATWNREESGTRTEYIAPVMLRHVQLVPRGSRVEDFEIVLDDEITINPALVAYLERHHGVTIDVDEWVESTGYSHGFDPAPVFERLRALAKGIPGLLVNQRLVVSTFANITSPFVGEELPAGHPVLRALAGDEAARRSFGGPAARASAADEGQPTEPLAVGDRPAPDRSGGPSEESGSSRSAAGEAGAADAERPTAAAQSSTADEPAGADETAAGADDSAAGSADRRANDESGTDAERASADADDAGSDARAAAGGAGEADGSARGETGDVESDSDGARDTDPEASESTAAPAPQSAAEKSAADEESTASDDSASGDEPAGSTGTASTGSTAVPVGVKERKRAARKAAARERAERRAAVIDTPLAVRVAIRYDWIERIS